jgi:hypothetical protein
MTSYFLIDAKREYLFHGSYLNCRTHAEKICHDNKDLEVSLIRARAGENHASLIFTFDCDRQRQVSPPYIVGKKELKSLKRDARRSGR